MISTPIMRTIFLAIFAVGASAAYTGDIVQYWVNQSAALVSGPVVGGLPSPSSSWFPAIVHGAIYSAAVTSRKESRAFQQLAVSHAAHDALAWTFHGARLGNDIDAALRDVLSDIGIAQGSATYRKAARIGRDAAAEVAKKRADDGLNNFVDYVFGPEKPGVYQRTPGGRPLPDQPNAQFLRPFGGLKNIARFRSPAPPKATGKGYEKWVLEVKNIGSLNSTTRTADQTEIAYFWQESSVTGWNKFAHAIIKNSLANDVVASAKFYAQLNYALANAAIGSWDAKYTYNHWRPVTAIHRKGIWLESGRDVSDPDWVPLLRPTPSHPDYTSTHATFGGAGAAVLQSFNGGDGIDAAFSSNVTLDNQGVITRRYKSIARAELENARSRIYGGIHFTYAGTQGSALGRAIAEETLRLFDEHWDEF
ncbi:hypothetical protein NLU13_1787 [Sarocladium strictum]|uniref:Phosphatidic acid phosphatase type 2/haloperoxidase domain-containing protein n=1 Tax=Sarocladium strictum TaxID=5046 RepID=A0AA39GSG1_SARSR|nr:hypothetical protein NLU13_1787 [Sarocladium strictum]